MTTSYSFCLQTSLEPLFVDLIVGENDSPAFRDQNQSFAHVSSFDDDLIARLFDKQYYNHRTKIPIKQFYDHLYLLQVLISHLKKNLITKNDVKQQTDGDTKGVKITTSVVPEVDHFNLVENLRNNSYEVVKRILQIIKS